MSTSLGKYNNEKMGFQIPIRRIIAQYRQQTISGLSDLLHADKGFYQLYVGT